MNATNTQAIETIHKSMVNGQRRQAVSQIDEFGLYDFFEYYADYLENLYVDKGVAFAYLKDAASSYHRIKNR